MNEFIDWWFQHSKQRPLFWVCTPNHIGAGAIKTTDTIRFANWQRDELFMRTTTVKMLPKSGRGGATLPGEIMGVWLDIDFREGEAKSSKYPPRDVVDDLLAELPDPSAVVETGGGLHCYWKLDEPLSTLDNIGLLECWWRKCNHIWQSQGYLLDNVMNPDRLMRLPGSINFKQNDFATSWEINDLVYQKADLVDDCSVIPESDFEDNWIDQPTMQTAFNEIIDVDQVWLDQGFAKTGERTEPSGCFYLRPGSASNKSLTVWADTGVTTIHSTVVLDKLEFEQQHISPYRLCEKLGVLTTWRPKAEQRLKILEQEFEEVMAKGRQGYDTSDSRWHHASELRLMEERFAEIRRDKHDLIRPFPSQLLPDVLTDAAEDLAHLIGAPQEMTYAATIAVMALAVSGEIRVAFHDTPISLYFMIAGASASGKSPTMRKLMKSLKQADAEKVKAWRPHAKRYREELDKLESRIAKHAETNDPMPMEKLEERFLELSALCEPPNRILNKTTPAALLHALSFKRSAGIESGEGADWLASFRDSNSAEISGDALLDIYDGQSTSKATKGDGLITIDCTLSIFLATQSANLAKFTNLHESGFWQRFMYINLPEKSLVIRGESGYKNDPESVVLFNTITEEVADLAMNHFSGKSLEVELEAEELFLDWQWQTKKRGNEKHPAEFDERYGDNRLYEAMSKAHSHAIRIAGLIAVIRTGTDGVLPVVTVDDMTAGMGIADWFYDRRVADSLTDIDGTEIEKDKELWRMLDLDGYVTPTSLSKGSHYFKRDDTNGIKAWLSRFVDDGRLVALPRSKFKRP